jgi:hypothetical protein
MQLKLMHKRKEFILERKPKLQGETKDYHLNQKQFLFLSKKTP